MARSMPPLTRKKPSDVRSPVRNGWSRSSTSLVMSVGREGVGAGHEERRHAATSAARRAAASVRTNWEVGTSTLPPRWPHFFSDASWSSKCTPAAPASIIDRISSKALSGPPKPASASATIGASQSMSSSLPSAQAIWSARSSALLMRWTTAGAEFAGYRLWSGYVWPGEVRVGGDLPAGQVDRLQAGLHHLHGLQARLRAEGGDVVLVLQELPQALGAEPREVCSTRTEPRRRDDLVGAVRALDALPARVEAPLVGQSPGLLRPSIDAHRASVRMLPATHGTAGYR